MEQQCFCTTLPALLRRSTYFSSLENVFLFSLLCCNTPCINPGSGWGERFDLRWKHWGPCFNSSADSGLDRTHYWTVVLIRSQKQRLTSVSEIQRIGNLNSNVVVPRAGWQGFWVPVRLATADWGQHSPSPFYPTPYSQVLPPLVAWTGPQSL